MGGSILSQERRIVLLTCYSLYCTVDFTQKKPEWRLLCCTSFHRKSTNTQVTPDILYRYSGTANHWLLVIASCKLSWYLTTHATQMLLSGKLGHTQTSMTNSCMVWDPHQSDHHLVTTAAVTGCPTSLRWIQNNHSLLASGHPCFKVPEEPAISPRFWLSSLIKSHPFPGRLYFPHLKTVCIQGSSLMTNTKPYSLEVFGDHVWSSFMSPGKTGDTAKCPLYGNETPSQPGYKQRDIGWRWRSSSESIKHFCWFLTWGISVPVLAAVIQELLR